jgi:Bifunctional DNA primase/polymerase, N-terminal
MVVAGLRLIAEHATNRVLILAGIIARGGQWVCSCWAGHSCPRPGKHPLKVLTPDGVWNATRNPAVLRRWFSEHPEGNLGWAVGPDRLVVDEDGELGRRTLSELEMPSTRVNISGRADGGCHRIYAASRPCGNGGDLPGVDLRGVGGYLVAPPSRHFSGARYQANDGPIAPAPQWAEQAAGVPKPGSVERWAIADLWIPQQVRSQLHDDDDKEPDVDKRGKNRSRYRNRSDVIWSVIWSLLNRGWTDEQIITLIRSGSTLHHRYVGDPTRQLAREIDKARDEIPFCPARAMTSADHVALADLHFRGTPTCRKVLHTLQQKCAKQNEGRFTASRDDLALAASCSAPSVTAAIKYLTQQRWIARVSEPTATRAAMYLLVLPRETNLEDLDSLSAVSLTPTHRNNNSERLVGVTECATRVGTLDLPAHGDALRFGKDTVGKSYPLIRAMGTGATSVAALSAVLGWKPDRVRRHLCQLEDHGIAIRTGQLWALAADALDVIEQLGASSSRAGAGERQQEQISRKRVLRHASKIRHTRGKGSSLDYEWVSFDVYDATTGEFVEACQRRLTERELMGQQGVVGGILLSLGKVTFSDTHGFPVGQLDRWYGDGEGHREIVKRPRRSRSGERD